MPDGRTRQRPRTAMPEPEQDSTHGESLLFVPFVWFEVTLFSVVLVWLLSLATMVMHPHSCLWIDGEEGGFYNDLVDD